jgi:ADP-ribose pyrophosphatase
MIRTIYKGKRLKLVIYKDKFREREIVFVPESVAIIPIKNNKILLVKQFRYPFGYIWEIPAGKIEKNENPLKAAKRELLEETGYKGKFEKIGKFIITPGYSNEVMHFYLAYDIEKVKEFDKKEIKENKFFDINKVKTKDFKTNFAIYLLKYKLC